MAAKLRSILKPIPWSLLAKAAVFGGGWLYLPFPIFLAAALYFYLVPLFNTLKLALPFVLTLILAGLLPHGFWAALVFAIIFYLILGIKGLFFINRRAAYETLVFFIMFLLFLYFFFRLGGGVEGTALPWSFIVSLTFFLLVSGLINYEGVIGVEAQKLERRYKFLVLGLTSFLLWQLILVLLILPFSFIYQTAMIFLLAAIFLELILAYLNSNLTLRKVLANFTIFFIFAVFILSSTKWDL